MLALSEAGWIGISVPVGLLAMSWVAYMVRQMFNLTQAMATISATQAAMEKDHEQRIGRLEAWRDGAQFGTAVQSAAQYIEKGKSP